MGWKLLFLLGFVLAFGHGIYAVAQATSQAPDTFKLFGQLLRFPFFAIGLLFWTLLIFPFVFGFCALCLIGHVVLYPLLRLAVPIIMAFVGGKRPNFDGYWNDFPMRYFRWLRTGTVTMERWLLEGWS